MAKDPSVLFYTQDFLVGTSFFTSAQKGHYITLLCHQHQSSTGTLSLEKIKAVMGKEFEKNWPAIRQKFLQDETGFFNDRMRKETEKRKKYSESRRTNRKKISEDMKNISGTYDTSYDEHMENENENKEVKGVVGEQEYSLNWDLEKKLFLNDEQWFYNFCSQKKISKNQCFQLANDFVADLELKQDYKLAKEVKRHFTNWFNKSRAKILSEIPEPKNGSSARELEEKKNREKLGLNG